MFFVYVLRNPEGRLYIGVTGDLERRMSCHQSGQAGWTRTRGPWELVHSEQHLDRAQAMRRERALKSGSLNQQLRARIEREIGRAGPLEKD